MRTKNEDTRTAAQAYEQHELRIKALLETLKHQHFQHRYQAAAEPLNWGFVGDLEEIENRLAIAVSVLAPDEE